MRLMIVLLTIAISWAGIGRADEIILIGSEQSGQVDEAKRIQAEELAREQTDTTEDVFNNMRFAQEMYRNEQQVEIEKGKIAWLLKSKNWDKEWRLREVLKVRASKGDPVANFYMGLLSAESGYFLKDGVVGKKFYNEALAYYKEACLKNAVSGCWNIAVMYADGTGVMKSNLAAVEWYYKAGVGYLAIGEREMALAALESIQKNDKNHALAKKLNALLQKGAPR